MNTGYESKTIKVASTVAVPCNAVRYFGSVRKAIKNELFGRGSVRHGYCGCDLLPYRVQALWHENDYDDAIATRYVEYYVSVNITYQRNVHQKYITENILNDAAFFPTEINALIAENVV